MRNANLSFPGDTYISVGRLRQLHQTGFIADINNIENVFYKSVLTETLVILKDLLIKLEKANNPITLKIKVPITKYCPNGTITELIKVFRDTFCHKYSPKTVIHTWPDGSTLSVIFEYKKTKTDVYFMSGENRLYIKRQLVKVIDTVIAKFMKYEDVRFLTDILL